jgi:hypothetical protein
MKMRYEYDFGDDWVHEVRAREIRREAAQPAFQCLGGARACPPEDCGGVGGYLDLLLAQEHENHARHAETLEWLGDPFDPEAFDLVAADRAVAGVARRRGP